MQECRDREINPAVFTKLRVPRMHKIFAPAIFRISAAPSSLFYTTCFSNRRGRGGTLLSACFSSVPPSPNTIKLFPTRNLPTTMRPATGIRSCRFCARCLFSLIVHSSLTLNSRLSHYPIPQNLLSLSSFLISNVTLT